MDILPRSVRVYALRIAFEVCRFSDSDGGGDWAKNSPSSCVEVVWCVQSCCLGIRGLSVNSDTIFGLLRIGEYLTTTKQYANCSIIYHGTKKKSAVYQSCKRPIILKAIGEWGVCSSDRPSCVLLLLAARPGQILGRTRSVVILNWIIQMPYLFWSLPRVLSLQSTFVTLWPIFYLTGSIRGER
jgi:hypothetical protein